MFGLSGAHLLILLVVVLVIFGGKKLPELGEGLGKGLRNFKKGLSGLDEEKAPVEKLRSPADAHRDEKD